MDGLLYYSITCITYLSPLMFVLACTSLSAGMFSDICTKHESLTVVPGQFEQLLSTQVQCPNSSCLPKTVLHSTTNPFHQDHAPTCALPFLWNCYTRGSHHLVIHTCNYYPHQQPQASNDQTFGEHDEVSKCTHFKSLTQEPLLD